MPIPPVVGTPARPSAGADAEVGGAAVVVGGGGGGGSAVQPDSRTSAAQKAAPRITNPAESRRTRSGANPLTGSVSAVAAGRIGNDRHSTGPFRVFPRSPW